MKKICQSLALIACVMVSACRSNQSIQATTLNPEPHSFDLKGFSALSLQGVADVSFTQWETYGVVVENFYEDRDEIYVEGNTLVVARKSSYRNEGKRKQERPRLRVRVSAPILQSLNGSGVGSLDIGPLHSADFVFNLSGVVKCRFHGLEAEEIRGNVSGVSNLNGTLSADKDVKLSYTGVVSGLLQVECQNLDYQNSGTGSHDLSFKGHTVALENSGTGSHHIRIEADEAKVKNDGTGRWDFNIQAQSLQVRHSGTGSNFFRLDCKKLSINNNGVGNIRLEGTADETVFTGTGISRIDTRNLNNF
ncbi:MAG: DUF2807 domain-containing protein [Alloprevotella sp.]|nr:DUF2807 domain-containing protein [Alloprevotella sp.]